MRTGTAAVILSGGGGAWWLTTQPARSAREPWRAASEGLGDPRLDVLAYAILAPSAHNMQPWRIALDDGLGFTVYCDLDRLLPGTDPPSRQTTISFGCFLELCRMAAAASGYRAEINYFPEGEPQPVLDHRPVARVELTPDTSIRADPLFTSVLERRTNRLEFGKELAVDPGVLTSLRDATVDGVAVSTTSDENEIEALRNLAVEAWFIEWSTERTRRESIAVTRIGRTEVDANPFGISIDDRFSATLGIAGLLTREAMDDPESVAYGESFAFYERACRSATAFVWSTTPTNSRRAQLEAGRAWVRTQLAANSVGVSFHPLSQALQEFPEMAQHYRRAKDLLARNQDHTVQMLARIGYAPDIGPAPRERLKTQLVPL